jgi:hypothetical protein
MGHAPASAQTLAAAAPGIHRPRYRPECPLLWRPDGRLQIGEGRHHIIATDISVQMAEWLLGLDGLRTWDQVYQDLPIGLTQAVRLLHAANLAAALDDAARIPDAWRWVDRAAREASEADLLAARLTWGGGEDSLAVIDRRMRTRVEVRGSGVLASEAQSAFAASGFVLPPSSPPSTVSDDDKDGAGLEEEQRTRLGDGLSKAPSHDARAPAEGTARGPARIWVSDLVVLADSVHPIVTDDPLLPVPHLFIGAYGERAIIGPLVVPGVSSCLRCAYLHTRDVDPQWPSLSLQLTARIERLATRPIDRLLARHAATHAALLARAWVDEPQWTSGWHNRAVEVRLPRGEAIARERPWHPLCGCSWPSRMSGSAHAG